MPEQKHIETVVLPDSLRQERRAERQRKNPTRNQTASSKPRRPQKNPK